MAGYSARQSSFTTGDTITAAHSNNEFNAILAAFHVSTGHTHDGTTAGDGGPLSTLYSNAISMGTGADTDIAVTFNANSNDGVITWMEDEDYFKFSDDILVDSTEKLQFRDTAIYLYSSADGQLDLVADTEIQIAATTVDINGNVDISGTLTIGSAGISEAELEILDGATVTTTELNIIDGDTSATSTTVADADRVVYNDAGTMKQVAVTDLDTYISATSKTLTNKTLTSPVLNTGVSGTAVADEDDMSSNSATKLATQQSIKAYVDAQITAEDLDVSSDSGTIAIDLDSETLTIAGGTGLDSSATSNTVTLAIDSTVTTLTGSQTLTNKTLTSPVLNTGVSGTAIADEDDMSSNSATKLATQQSIKAYVDAVSTGVTTFVMEDDDGTEVTISNNKEIKYIGSGLTTNWTDTDNGTDGDPYDLTFTVDAAQTGITSILATDLKIGEDNETKIDFETANEIHFYANNTEQVYLADNIFGPQSDSDVDLGTTSVRWKDAYVDSVTVTDNVTVGGDLTVNGTTTTVNSTTVTIDDPIFTLGGDSAPGSDDNKDRGIEFRWHNGSAAKVGFFGYDDSESAFTFIPDASNSSEVFSGTVGNVIFGNITGTLQTAAQTNITSVGTLTALTVDNIAIDGATIGHTSDTDLMTLASGGLTVAGTIEGTTITASTALVPDASGGADLGSTSLEWGDLYIADDKKIYLGSDQNLSIEYDEDGNDTTAVVAAGGVSMAPHGSSAGNGTELRFQELAANGANYVGFKAPDAIASNEVWVLPNADGNADQVLKTDGSNTLSWADAGGGGEIDFVADGAIAAQKPVILTSAGKAQQIAETTTLASSASAVFTTMDNSDTATVNVSSVYESNSGTFVLAYKDLSGSSYGTAVAGTWSDGTMTWGTPVVFESSQIDDQPMLAAGGNRIHVSYRDSSGNGGIRSASISGTTLTFAAETAFTSAFGYASGGQDLMDSTIQVGRIGGCYDLSADRYLTLYANATESSYLYAVVSQLTDATTGAMTWGTPVVVNSATSDVYARGVQYDSSTSRCLVTYKDTASGTWAAGPGKAKVATVTAGTNSVAFGAEAEFEDGGATYIDVVEDPNTDRMLIIYVDQSDSGKGKAKVATITGGTTNTVAFGAETIFESDSTEELACAYNPDDNKILVLWGDRTNKLAEGAVATITGGTTNTVAFGSPVTFDPSGTKSSNTSWYGPGVAYDTTANRFVVAYNDVDDSYHTKVIGCTVSGTTPTFGSSVKLQADGAGNYCQVTDFPDDSATLVVFRNDGQSGRGEVHRVTGTGTTVTDAVTSHGWGAATYPVSSYDPDMQRVTIMHYNATNRLNSITYLPEDGNSPMGYHIAYDTSNDYIVMLYSGGGTANTFVRAISHNTSDGTYTALSSKATLNTSSINNYKSDVVFDPDTNRTIAAYLDNTNNETTANVIQTGGTAASPTVTVGSDVLLDSGDQGGGVDLTYDTVNNKVFLAYENVDDGEWKGAIGTVNSGTNAISFAGHATIWNPSSGSQTNAAAVFDDDKDRVMFFYRDGENGNDLTYKVITSGASSFSVATGAELSANDNRLGAGSASFGASKGVLLGTFDIDNSNKISYATTHFASSTTTNLDNGNYLGVAKAAISDTATGTIVVPGGLSAGHSSLTVGNHYFTNAAGTIGLVGNTLGEQYLGRATSTTEIQLLENEGYLYGTADGAITAGKPVQVKSDGDFQMISETTTSFSAGAGTAAQVYAGTTRSADIFYNTVTDKIVAVVEDTAAYGMAIYTGTVNGGTTNTVTWGSTSLFSGTAATNYIRTAFDPVSGYACVAFYYQQGGSANAFLFNNSSGTTSTFGSPTAGTAEFYNSDIIEADVVNIEENKWAIVYAGSSDYPRCRIATRSSGTTLSFGTEVTIQSNSSNSGGHDNVTVTYDKSQSKLLVMTRNSSGDVLAYVGTVDGTTTTWGSASGNLDGSGSAPIMNAGGLQYVPSGAVNVLAFRNTNNTEGRVIALKISGTSVVNASGTAPGLSTSVQFDSQTSIQPHIFVAYESTPVIVYSDDSVDINSIPFTVDGTTPTMGSDAVVATTTSTLIASGAYDPDTNRAVMIYEDNSSNDLYYRVMTIAGSETTTTMATDGESYLGIATKTVADNAQAEVATFGQIDAQQSGLTAGQKYFVQSDGSLATSADTSVPGHTGTVTTVAGKALSATKLLISE